ncbi:MAG: hypothetical protein C0418_06060, partial [Coriobacteriaceae bacterium]|nr:hypothetical protein [Coriobacteriaceae bacterium]
PALTLSGTDGSGYPQVRLRIGLPAELLAGDPSGKLVFAVVENGVPVDVAAIEPVGGESEPLDVVLLIDTSGSMKGAPMAAARESAERFVDAVGPDVRIAIVGFSSRPRVVSAFTTDRARLGKAIASLEPAGETSVYDALVTASKMSSDPGSRRAAVLLSDGGDTVSASSLDVAIRAMRSAGMPVYAVALSSPEFNPRALRLVASRTGGRLLEAKEAGSLSGYFEGIAEELTGAYDVTFASHRPNTKDLEIDLTAELDGKKAALKTVVTNPMYAGPVEDAGTGLTPISGGGLPALVVTTVLAFASVALLVGGAGLILIPEPTQLGQLKYYDQLQATADAASTTGGMKSKLVDAVGAAAGRGGFTDLFRGMLERAGLPVRPAEYITMHILLVVAVGVAARVLLRNLPVAFLLIIIATVVPLWALEYLARRRIRRFEEQLPDVLNLVAGSLRAGWGMMQAIDLAAKEVGEPAGPELRRAETEARLGVPVETALQSMADRLSSEDFAWAVTAISIQREVGGNLAEVLDIVANTVRERGALRRQIEGLTAEGRFSAIILICLPFVEIILLLLINPGYISLLWTNAIGVVISVLAVVLLVVGSIWLNKATKVEV